MGEAADELTPKAEHIEEQIEDTRSRMQNRLWELEDRTRQALSIRQRVAERPWAVLAGAAGVGMLLGLLGKRRRRRYHDREVFVGGAGL
jgi:ElaB/YqjD/DUF883 family membrane-anchored ribosome-binding protein